MVYLGSWLETSSSAALDLALVCISQYSVRFGLSPTPVCLHINTRTSGCKLPSQFDPNLISQSMSVVTQTTLDHHRTCLHLHQWMPWPNQGNSQYPYQVPPHPSSNFCLCHYLFLLYVILYISVYIFYIFLMNDRSGVVRTSIFLNIKWTWT